MSKKIIYGVAITLGLGMTSCADQENASKSASLNNEIDSVSYAYGIALGGSLKQQNVDLNSNAFKSGLEDAMKDEGKLTQEESNELLNGFFKKKQEEENKAKFGNNMKEGKDFLAENATKDGVITTPSGLQYEVIKEGNGPKPTTEDQVTTHYTGTLIDGTVFDSSVERGEPATFPVSGVIPGWTEALQLMSVGSKYRLYVPFELAYGERGAGQMIPPYATLIFEVELLGINQ